MPRLTPAKCPNCGAVLSIPPGSESVNCTFCGLASFVNRDARAPASMTHSSGAPIVHVPPRSGSGPVVAIVIVLTFVVGGIGIAASLLQGRVGGFRSAALVGDLVLVDANGDGSDDVLIRAIYVGDEVMHLRAFDGASGKNLWVSDPLLKASEPEIIATASGVVLAISQGVAVGLEPQSGKPRFKIELPERVEAVCQRGKEPLLLTRDDKLYTINSATGALALAGTPEKNSPLKPRPSCLLAPSDYESQQGMWMRELRSDDLQRVEGMRVETVLEYAGAPPYLMLGQRAVGSGVPMVGARTVDRVLWKSDVPTTEPLGAIEGKPKAAAIAQGHAFVAYVRVGERAIRIASFSLSDGRKGWETELAVGGGPTGLNVVASDRHVFVFTTKGNDGALRSLSLADGHLEWTAGG